MISLGDQHLLCISTLLLQHATLPVVRQGHAQVFLTHSVSVLSAEMTDKYDKKCWCWKMNLYYKPVSPNCQLAVTLVAAALDLIWMPDRRGKLHVPLSGSMKKLLWLFSNPLRKWVDGDEICGWRWNHRGSRALRRPLCSLEAEDTLESCWILKQHLGSK